MRLGPFIIALVLAAPGVVAQESVPDDSTTDETSPSTDETSPAPGGPSPWSQGVSRSDQNAALALFERGNALFDQSKYSAALPVFQRALNRWKHPAIHFNIAVCLVHAGRAIEAFEHLGEAMKFGDAPLGPELYARGKTYELLLKGRLTRLRIDCEKAGTKVSLDGKQVLDCPGSMLRWIEPGTHQVVARKDGFEPYTRSIRAEPGEELSVRPKLRRKTLRETYEVRRWNKWIPWSIVAGGVLVGAAGIPFQLAADDSFQSYRDGVARDCPMGCQTDGLSEETLDFRDRGRTQRAIGITAYAVGGAIVTTGVVLSVLNRPKTMERTVFAVTPRSVHLRVSF